MFISNILVLFIHLFFKKSDVSTCIYLCVQCAFLVPGRPEEGAGSLGAGVVDTCEPPHGCWELDLGPLQEQQTLSHLSTPDF